MKKIMLTISVSLLAMFAAGCYSTSVASPENALQTQSGPTNSDNNSHSNSETASHRTWINGHYEGNTWIRGYFKN